MDKIEISNIHINEDSLSPIDHYFFSKFNKKLEKIEEYFNGYNWHEAFMILRPFFWNEICDNYIEAIKYRFYSDDIIIKKNSLKNALNLFYRILKIFAIIIPFISEEIYSIIYKEFKGLDSVHFEQWPSPYEEISESLAKSGEIGINLIQNLRKMKSQLQIPLNQELEKVMIILDNNKTKIVENIRKDIAETIRIKKLEVLGNKDKHEIENDPDLKENFEDLELTIFLYK